MRTRIITSYVVLLAFSAIVSSFVLTEILLLRLGDRIEADLDQEILWYSSPSEGEHSLAAARHVAGEVHVVADCEAPVELSGLALGEHTFAVRVDLNGLADPTPARHHRHGCHDVVGDRLPEVERHRAGAGDVRRRRQPTAS